MLASLLIHAAAVVLVVRLVQYVPARWLEFLREQQVAREAERITYLSFPQTSRSTQAREGGDNRAPARAAPMPLVAPRAVPSTIPEPPKAAVAVPPGPTGGGTGAVIGNGGPTQGLRPSFADPRLWAPPTPAPTIPLTPTQRLDSAIVSMVQVLQDSLAQLPHERAPGDWTYTRNGKKYGIDGSLIHLGNFSLPTALLALLPMNATANPSALERDRRLTMMRGEIQAQAARAARDDDFYRAVKALRERKERERAEQKKTSGDPTGVPVSKP